MNFRYDINGLRAIAVIAVVLFHFNPSWVSGGFAGVDVFFVISGFLMTGIIFRGFEDNSFNLFKFYVARANRIIPALAILCLVLLVFGWLYLTPLDYKPLSKHTASSMGFLSNVIYWQESGYFDADSHKKWLLHTWSLSVEWQFYIIYPVVLMALKRFLSIENLKRLLLVGTVLGFGFSVLATMKWPNPAYYLLPTRAWEMMFGGIAYLYPWSLKEHQKKLLELTGLALILLSYAFISSDISWPGHLALFPVLGAYLVIAANQQNSIATNNIIFQALGKWSYSIYLWHWPVVVFGYYFDIDNWWVLGLPISVFLGGLSFKYIETINFKTGYKWINIYKIKPLYLSLLVSAIAFFVWNSNGVDSRVRKEYQYTGKEYHAKYYGGRGYSDNEIIYINTRKDDYDIAFSGDSYALQYAKAIDESTLKVLGLFDHGCLIFPNYSRWLNGKEDNTCSNEFKKLEQELINNNKPLLLAHAWDYYVSVLTKKGSNKKLSIGKDEYYDIIKSELSEITNRLGNRKYYILGVPQPAKENAYSCLASKELIGYKILGGDCPKIQARKNLYINDILADFSNTHDNVFYINPNNALCNDTNCKTIIDREPIHSDQSHLSVYGSKLVYQYILKKINLL